MLKVLPRRARLTQRELGAAVGYSETYITRLEGDARLPDPAAVLALFVEALGLRDEPELARRLVELADVRFLTADVLPLLQNLVDKSLVVAEEDELSGGARYRLLETVRQYVCDAAVGAARNTGTAAPAAPAANTAPSFRDGVWLAELAPRRWRRRSASVLTLQSRAQAAACGDSA